ncbi:hypothetical protein OIDMADRAFT_61618 [Oidiodendron maius Zn]|uniref:Uncharacterized protein n=1 Tax=Oidiodendron maius (strain Zn) TaxID=913774 RepID=A0A0C3CUS0_OIDMZ|nr:hypothetical protein OIDMADRAFT_61618 [Oidiodendron maius Zn]
MAAPAADGRPQGAQASTVPQSSDAGNNYDSGPLGTTDDRFIHSTHRKFLGSSAPLGFFHASGALASSLPSVSDVKKGKYNSDGWSGPGQRRNSQAHRNSDFHILNSSGKQLMTAKVAPRTRPFSVPEPMTEIEITRSEDKETRTRTCRKAESLLVKDNPASEARDLTLSQAVLHDPKVSYANGYQFPPKHTLGKSITIALHAFWKFFLTPFGFIITIYSLNVVAWGGMLFIVLIGGAPAMCHPKCSDIHSKAKVWIEITSQIINALFNVTGLGLIPWRFRDLYYLLKWRIYHDESALRCLAGINRDWFRLQGSQDIPIHFDQKQDSIPSNLSESIFALPIDKTPDPPLTGERAQPTPYWKLDFYIWCYVWNSILQIVLDGIMWGLNRFNRPGWATGLFISLACIVAAAGGFVVFKAGRIVKKVEGVPVSEEDQAILKQMRDLEGTIGDRMQREDTGDEDGL